MQEFFRFIYAQNLNFMVLIIAIFVIIFANAGATSKNKKIFLAINAMVCILFFLAAIYRTLLSRSITHNEIELIPFGFYFTTDDKVAAIRTFFMNALLFVPLGLSMPYVLSKKPYKRNIFISIGFAAILSASIEFLQYYYHLGRCETDDVIANTLGATIGTLSYCLYMRILKNQRKGSLMHKTINENQKLLLQLCAKSLFDKDITVPDELDCKELIEESKRQAVFPIAYSLIKDKCDANCDKVFSQIIAKNIRVEFAHNEVHRALSENNVSYIVLKGVASASYYKEPMLRMMGDVDVLVEPQNIARADELLKSIGFVTTDDINGDDMHITYKRKDGISCELHRHINGIPRNEVEYVVQKYLDDVFEKATEFKASNGGCIVPSRFHHGLILLLHTASHLTSEGVGLRHLCDWAVFVNSFSNDEFVSVFKKPLKEMGLWRFAQLLTLCCIKFLDCDVKEWAEQADDNLIDSIVSDILNGGNFGNKDTDRYNQIKYISDRKEGTTSKKKPLLQLFVSINEKTKKEIKFVNKSKFFLPIGWIFTVCKYFYLIFIGKRSFDNIQTINGAKHRKNIYSEFRLFETD